MAWQTSGVAAGDPSTRRRQSAGRQAFNLAATPSPSPQGGTSGRGEARRRLRAQGPSGRAGHSAGAQDEQEQGECGEPRRGGGALRRRQPAALRNVHGPPARHEGRPPAVPAFHSFVGVLGLAPPPVSLLLHGPLLSGASAVPPTHLLRSRCPRSASSAVAQYQNRPLWKGLRPRRCFVLRLAGRPDCISRVPCRQEKWHRLQGACAGFQTCTHAFHAQPRGEQKHILTNHVDMCVRNASALLASSCWRTPRDAEPGPTRSGSAQVPGQAAYMRVLRTPLLVMWRRITSSVQRTPFERAQRTDRSHSSFEVCGTKVNPKPSTRNHPEPSGVEHQRGGGGAPLPGTRLAPLRGRPVRRGAVQTAAAGAALHHQAGACDLLLGETTSRPLGMLSIEIVSRPPSSSMPRLPHQKTRGVKWPALSLEDTN